MANRRQFLGGAAATVLSTTACRPQWPLPKPGGRLPRPDQSGLDNIVVVCMENRSFDHWLGWVPGATGRQRKLEYLDDAGVAHPTHHLTDTTGCGFNDPSHSYTGGRLQLNGGAMDGFRLGKNDDYALGYYERADLPLTRQLVDNFTVCDHWFAGILGPTYPNRFYTHTAATDRISNTAVVNEMRSIWDLLDEAQVPSRYYYTDLPFLALFGSKHIAKAKQLDQFFLDAEAGTLPPFTYVDPGFFNATQCDDHPHADIRRGQNFVGRVVEAVVESPQWESTLLILTYDEWGGFFDTVLPPRFPDLVENPGGGTDDPDHGQAGFRVPTILVSPFAQSRRITKTVFEHSAILKVAEWRFGLPSLTPRDAASANIASVLDFSPRRRKRPTITVPEDPGYNPCLSAATMATASTMGASVAERGSPVLQQNVDDEGGNWADLVDSGIFNGWDLGI
ncbi:MAG: phospholipase [Actinobacteria bacterium]|nr:phospholipase [Actinomycetota bacterium]